MNRDLVFGSAAFALAVGYYLTATTIPASLLADAVGPQGLPKTYAVLLGGLSLILIIRSIVRGIRLPAFARLRRGLAVARSARGGGQPDSGDAPVRGIRLEPESTVAPARELRPKPDLRRVAGLLAIGVAYVVVVPWLGYMPSVAMLIMATIYYQGGALNRQVVVVAMSGAVVFWMLFVMLLGIPQPPGVWPSLW